MDGKTIKKNLIKRTQRKGLTKIYFNILIVKINLLYFSLSKN